jgi:hypothetical protein
MSRKEQVMTETKVFELVRVTDESRKAFRMEGMFRGRELAEGDALVVGYPASPRTMNDGALVLAYPPRRPKEMLLARCRRVDDEIVVVPTDVNATPFIPKDVLPVLQVHLSV